MVGDRPENGGNSHSSGKIEVSNKPSMNKKPTMMELRSFPTKSKNIDLALEISSDDYAKVGRCLLEDDTGAKIANFESSKRGNIKDINDAVFKEWLKGSGKLPVMWKTFLVCLKEAELNSLHDLVYDKL